jgi:predicted methyltransferase
MDLASVPQLVTAYENLSWPEFMGETIPVVKQYLSRFEEIAEAGPEEDQETLQSMVRHESAILRWMEMEAAGDTEGSLDTIIEQLEFPLPAFEAE